MPVKTYQCPQCDAPLVWQTDAMHCAHCNQDFSVETMEEFSSILEEDATVSQLDWQPFADGQTFSEEEQSALHELVCPSCGAALFTAESTAATRCAYCGNSALLTEKVSGALRPDAVIPFAVTRKTAESLLRAHFHHKPLLPDDFRRSCRVEDVTGLYVPYYLFDCEADARATYHATRVRTYRRGDWQHTDTLHYCVERCGRVQFERVPVDACRRVDNTLTEAIEPFDYADCRDFNAGFLAGFQADCRDQSVEDCAPRANDRITTSALRALRDTVTGYATVADTAQSVRLQQGRVRYVLLPVWLLNVRYGTQVFPFAVNGQSGRLVGELPVDKRKYRLFKWGGFAALWVAAALITAFFL